MDANTIENYNRPEDKADAMRWDSMRLRRNGLMGIPKFFVNGFAADKWCHCGCDLLKSWCPNRSEVK
jgi:hypothetical protein